MVADLDYSSAYTKWFNSLTKEEKAKAREMKVDKPLVEERHHGTGAGVDGFSFTQGSGVSEPEVSKLALLAGAANDIAVVVGRDPFFDLASKEERESVSDLEESSIKQEAISGLLSYLWSAKGNVAPTAKDIVLRLYCIVYCVRPQLLGENFSLQKIADEFGLTRAAISKTIINQNKRLNIRGRNQKPATVVSKFIEGTSRYHSERLANARKAKRKAYLKAWVEKNREKHRATNAAYYAANAKRLNDAAKAKRAKARVDKAAWI